MPARIRCAWADSEPIYREYHDKEWGVPIGLGVSTDDAGPADKKHFEFLMLESAQAGLSWITILKRREGYRKAFANFNVHAVSEFTQEDQDILLQNPGIIRNKLKIKAAIKNARVFIEIQHEFGSFNDYIWGFVDGIPLNNQRETLDEVPATSELSDKVSKDLKSRGMSFVGSTIIYAHLQASGIINDHVRTCFRFQE